MTTDQPMSEAEYLGRASDPTNLLPLSANPLLDRLEPGAADRIRRDLNSLVLLDNIEDEALTAARDAVVSAAQDLVAVLTSKPDVFVHRSTTTAVEHLVLTVNALKEVTP